MRRTRSKRDPGVATGVLRRHRGAVAAATALMGIHQACEASVPLLVGVIVDEAVARGDGAALASLLAGLTLLFCVLSLSSRFGRRTAERTQQTATHELRLRIARRVLDPRGGAEADRLAGDLTTVAGADAARVGGLAALVPTATASLLGGLVGGAFLLTRSPLLGLIVLGGLPLLLLVVARLGRPLAQRAGREQAEIAATGAVAADLVAGLRPLKGIGGGATGEARYRAASRRARAASIRVARAQAAYEATIALCAGLLLVAVAIVGGRHAAAGELSLGDLIAAFGLTQFLVGPLSRLGRVGAQLSRARAATQRVATLLAAAPAIDAGDGAPASHGGGALVLRDVRWGALEGVSLAVAPGELVGIAALDPGHGALLVDLLAREADPDAGVIELDGAALPTLDPPTLRSVLLVAEHDAALFDGTLRETVLGASGDAAALDAALEAAAADEVVTSVPGGLNGAVAARGRTLSGGQRQRIALARALCAQPRVLVLHEPTTAVDAATEARIAAGLRAARSGRTTILVTTSPALLGTCDRVVVLDGGTLAEGRHEQLLGDDHRYRAAVLA